MACYYLDSKSGQEIELRLRELGSEILETDWTCSIQYYYQGILPNGNNQPLVDTQLPLFSVVSVGPSDTFVVTEVTERVSIADSTPFTCSLQACDIIRMDSSFFEKIRIFNSKNKNAKKRCVDFTIFRLDGNDIYLADNLVIFSTKDYAKVLPAYLLQRHDDLERFMINMEARAGFRRPSPQTDYERFAFWIYSYFKWKDAVTIPFTRHTDRPVELSDCAFAKGLRLE